MSAMNRTVYLVESLVGVVGGIGGSEMVVACSGNKYTAVGIEGLETESMCAEGFVAGFGQSNLKALCVAAEAAAVGIADLVIEPACTDRWSAAVPALEKSMTRLGLAEEKLVADQLAAAAIFVQVDLGQAD